MSYISFDSTYIVIGMVKLSLSMLFSFIIAIERELHSHPGGACTHILVGFGSCLFTLISVNLKEKYSSTTADPARICAQIVSGMGFLGSATIFKSDNYVKGINTAANLWISAAVSMAIGCDLWEFALITSLFTVIILYTNNRYKKWRYSLIENEEKNEQELQDIENRINNEDPLDAPYNDNNKDE